MLHLRIWFIAQLLNFIVGFFVIGVANIIVAPFAFICGLPVIGLFWIVTWGIQKVELPPLGILYIVLMAFPLCTALGAWQTMELFEFGRREQGDFMIAPVVATVLSVLLHSRNMHELSASDEKQKSNNSNIPIINLRTKK